MTYEQYVNDPGTTLNGAINSSVTSLVVASATGYPTSGNFRILIDSELMEVTAVSGTTWTVTRGAESSTAASHSNGAAVNAILSAAAIDAIRANVSQIGTYANLPTSGMKSGDQYHCSDAWYNFVFDGTNWIPFVRGQAPGQVYQPPTSGWSWQNQGSSPAAAVDTTRGGIQLTCAAAGANSIRCYTRSAITPPWTVDVLFCPTFIFNAANPEVGLVMLESGTGKFVEYCVQGGTDNVAILSGTALSSGATTSISNNTNLSPGSSWFRWFQFSYDNSAHTVTFRFSGDGVNWIKLDTTTVTTPFTTAPDTYGICVNPRNSTFNIATWLVSWNERNATS